MKVHVVNCDARSSVAMRYGMGSFMRMFYRALHHAGIEIVHRVESADIVHVMNPHSADTLHRAGDKHVIAHLHVPIGNGELREAIESADLCIAVSKLLADELGVKCTVLHNAVLPYREMHVDRIYDFAFTGRGSVVKGVHLLRGFGEHSCITIGDVHVDECINFGYMPEGERFNELLASTRVHLLPSLFEPFGMSTLYAMTQGCIPAISNRAGVSEVVPDDLKIALKPEEFNPDDVFNEYLDRGMHELHGEVREFARGMDYRWYADRIREIYTELLYK